jgi:hypothetical protein
LGVGWQVSGFSVIEREYFNGQVRYLLDGEPMMPGGAGYQTIRQPFDRISQSGNGWQVIRPDGVVMTYGAIFTNSQNVPGTGSFRWELTSVQDMFGNIATYNWSCTYYPLGSGQDKQQCYPSSVAYGDITVTFNTDTTGRPTTDQATFATGGPLMGQLTQRLASIDVTVGNVENRNL